MKGKFLDAFALVLWLLILILICWLTALWYSLFFLVWWLDMPFHFLGGLSIFMLGWVLSKRFDLGYGPSKHGFFHSFVALMGFVVLVGVLWEFWELFIDRYFLRGFIQFPGAYEDTLSDLFFDLLGGSFGFLFYKIFRV